MLTNSFDNNSPPQALRANNLTIISGKVSGNCSGVQLVGPSSPARASGELVAFRVGLVPSVDLREAPEGI